MSRQSVAVVAFDRISPFHLSVPCLVFGQECYDPCAQAFDLRVCTAEPGRLRTTVGFTIEAEAELPRDMAQAFLSGNLGVMDYYHLKNMEADTTMRESIARPDNGPAKITK